MCVQRAKQSLQIQPVFFCLFRVRLYFTSFKPRIITWRRRKCFQRQIRNIPQFLSQTAGMQAEFHIHALKDIHQHIDRVLQLCTVLQIDQNHVLGPF